MTVPATVPARTRVSCERVSEFCLDATDEPDEPSVRTACFACGLPACADCTIVLSRYHRWRNKRVCLDCLPQQGYGREAAEHVWHRNGYTGEPPAWLLATYGADDPVLTGHRR